MWRIPSKPSLPLLIAFVLCAGSAAAAPVTFADRAAFDAANQPQTLITFDDLSGSLCGPVHPFVPDPCVIQIQTVTFTATIGSPEDDQRPLLSIDTTAVGAEGSPGLLSNEIPTEPGQFFFNLDSPFVAFDLRGFGPGALFGVELTEGDGSLSQFQTTGFFGASSPSGFTDVSLFSLPAGPSSFRSNVILDNVAVSSATGVPEPSVLALLLVALAALAITKEDLRGAVLRRPRAGTGSASSVRRPD